MKTNKKNNIKTNDDKTDHDEIAELLWLTLLFDFYGELLGEHKRQIYEDYILNDLSLGEIADEVGISRQGVHDIIKRCSRKLNEYEDKLHLAEKFKAAKKKVDEIKSISKHMKLTNDYSGIDRIERLSQEIMNEL